MKKIVPVGPYTVKFELSRPDTSVLDGLTSANLSMLSTKAINAGTLAKTPDGTGPYTFVSWTPNNSFTVKANPTYWGGKVTLPQIEIKTIPTEQSIASALEANSVQLGLLTEPQVAEHLPSSITVQKVLDLSYRALMLQDKTGPAREPRQPPRALVRDRPPAGRRERPARPGRRRRPGAARPLRPSPIPASARART